MRIIALLAFALGALVSPVLAQSFEDPRALIESIYAPYLRDEVPDNYPTDQFTPTLKTLWDDMETRQNESEMAILDFDPIINGQDFQITDFAVADPLIEGDKATVVATFRNFSEPQEMHYTLLHQADGWKIDDLESVAGEFTYRLSEILAEDPMLN